MFRRMERMVCLWLYFDNYLIVGQIWSSQVKFGCKPVGQVEKEQAKDVIVFGGFQV